MSSYNSIISNQLFDAAQYDINIKVTNIHSRGRKAFWMK